jgi:hypothetical protein
MIVEVGGGNSGIAEYLEKGMKQGRLFERDELDQRIVLDGDLELTHKIINSIEDNGQERYLHITLSFREDDISNDLLQSVTAEYKSLLMSAYNDDEYNFYAEAHLPKIQSIEDSKTGKMIERKPHIHIVIPERNLLTGNKLLPTGYTDTVNVKNIPYLDSIQEYINYKYNLESPKDFMREGGNHSANVLSRIKGDFFGEKQSQFKANLVDEISSGKINSLDSFQSRLSDFGEVKIRNKGKSNQYFAVKLEGDKKFTNLKHPVFSEQAIVSKTLPKPDIDTINARLADWQNRVSKEIKFVDFATPAFRQKYAKADLVEKSQLLTEREQNYERKYRQGASLNAASGRKRNHQSNASNTNSRQSKPIARASIGLSSMQGGVVVRGATQRGARTQSLLSENELNHLRNGEPGINSSLRRNDSSRRRGNARGINVKPPISSRSFNQIASGVPKQSYQKNIFDKSIESRPYITPFEHYLDTVGNIVRIAKFSDSNTLSHLANQTLDSHAKQAEIAQYAEIRRNIDPNAFLNQLGKIYGIDPKNHKVSYAKDGSPRFNVGKRNLNASDYLTKHLNLQWHEAKSVLEFCYANQQNKNINQERLAYEQMKSNIKAFDCDLRRFEKYARATLHNMNVDNRNAFREEKKRIYARKNLTPKIRNQELAIASFRCMQRQELIDQFAENLSSFVKEAKQYFQQSGYSIRSLEEIDMATKAGQKLQALQPNSIAPASKELEQENGEKKGFFERVFDRVREQNPLNQQNAQAQQSQQAKDIYATQSGEEVNADYRGNIQFKNLALQESLKKNNIGVAKHTDGKIEYKSLTDGKLICTDDGDKMKIHQKDMSAENVKFFLEVSIDRYGNELQINGKKEFKDMVVEAAAANNLPVILKPAELQEQLIARRKELEMEQKVEVGNSIEKAAPEQTQEKAKDEQRSSIEPVQSKSSANDEFRQPQAAEPLKAQPEQAHTPAEQPKPVQEQPQATTEKAAAISQTKAESSKTTERPAYTIEFKYDESAKQRKTQESAVVPGRFYSVKVNGVPVQEAMKSDPNVAKVLENAAKNSPDLKAKNITADNLKSGFILGLQTSNVGAGKFDKPETLKLNSSGQQISTPKAQAEKSAGASKGKSSDISL